MKNSFHEELRCVFHKYHMNILLGDFIAKVGREESSKLRYIQKSQPKVRCSHITTSINILGYFREAKLKIR
jgi:hypothetical protein